LPQVRPPETPERELMGPVDRVHQIYPAVPAPDTLMTSVGPMPKLFKTFPGMSFLLNGGKRPPDTTGAVGIKYYVQAINISFGIFDKISGIPVGYVYEG